MKEIFKRLNEENNSSLVVFDFDGTMTLSNSETSIGVFTKYLPEKYRKRKIMIDRLTDKTRNSFLLKLLWKYKLFHLSKYLNIDLLNSIKYESDFKINDVAREIFEILDDRIPVLVYSSGLKTIIERVIKSNGMFRSNLFVVANEINLFCSVGLRKTITPKKSKLKNCKYKNVVVIGDNFADLRIAKNAIKIIVENDEFRVIE